MHKASAGVRFPDFAAGAEAVRALVAERPVPDQLPPARPGRGGADRRRRDGGAPCSSSGSSRPTTRSTPGWTARSSCAADHGGDGADTAQRRRAGEDSVGAWREAFLRAPYLRDTFVAWACISETFETAITWDRFAAFHAAVIEAARARGARDLRRRAA